MRKGGKCGRCEEGGRGVVMDKDGEGERMKEEYV